MSVLNAWSTLAVSPGASAEQPPRAITVMRATLFLCNTKFLCRVFILVNLHRLRLPYVYLPHPAIHHRRAECHVDHFPAVVHPHYGQGAAMLPGVLPG